MEATTAFFLYLALGTVCAFAAIASCRTPEAALRLASGVRLLCVFLALAGLIGVLAVSLLPSSSVTGAARTLLRIVGYLGWLVVGAAVCAALLATMRGGRAATAATSAIRSFIASLALSTGLAIYIACAFFGFEVGKAAHDAEMRQFFIGSGYPVWFMYAVMAAEIVGALALLARSTRLIAAGWLCAVMIGAIATHWRNSDPFSDSLDALRMLILAGCIAVLELRCRATARYVRHPLG